VAELLTMDANEEASRQRVWDVIEEIGVCMLAAHDGERIRARPMARRLRFTNNNAIYFLTDAESPKSDQIEADSTVCLAFAAPEKGEYLSITGDARLLDDRPLIRALWRGADGAFWDGPEAPSLRALEVTPRDAQFWDRRGGLVGAVQLMAAAVLGRANGASGNGVGHNEKVRL
jgi:general stress protein 26